MCKCFAGKYDHNVKAGHIAHLCIYSIATAIAGALYRHYCISYFGVVKAGRRTLIAVMRTTILLYTLHSNSIQAMLYE